MDTVVRMMNAIEKINTSLYPASIIVPVTLAVLFLSFLIWNMTKPGHLPSLFMKATITLCYIYAGIPLFFTTSELGNQAIIGGIALSAFALLFLVSIFNKKMIFEVDKRRHVRLTGIVLIIVGIFLYPVIEHRTGFRWPAMAVFGMECPTTITVIGLMILTIKHMPKYLMIILFSNAVLTGTGVALMGAVFDWSYALAGYAGWIMLALNWKRTITIEKITENKNQFLDLLLLADEQENMIDKYLSDGDLFALFDGNLKSVCVVLPIDADTCELKNIATYERYRGHGYGRTLIRYISEYYKNDYTTMLVGTGETPSTLSFYESCGFTQSHRIKNFFIDNYNHLMFEDGIQLVDMIYLKKKL